MNNQTELGVPLALIAAMAANGVIGKDNALPWHLPEDLAWFRKVTMGKPIVMGRRTFESIGRPLPGRDNIVVSAGMDDPPAGVLVCASPEAAVETGRRRAAALGAGEVMLIGGGQLYRWAMPHTQRMYLTLIHCEIDGDAWFPDWETRDWRTVERTDLTSGQGLDYSLLVLDRNR